MENTPEFIFASLGAGLSNSVLFAINTGFRGETLAKVINQANIMCLIMNGGTAAELSASWVRFTVHRGAKISSMWAAKAKSKVRAIGTWNRHRRIPSSSAGSYRVPVDNFSPVIVIYTSGTTGCPRGFPAPISS